ncbi:MAG: FG-GAP repeat protein [Chthoniobacterales bacterium]
MAHGRLITIFALLLCHIAVARAEFHPVVEVMSGSLLGASKGQKWLNSEQAGKDFRPGTTFRLFTLDKEVGTMKAGKAEPELEICSKVWIVTFTERPTTGTIGLAAPWNALPRPVRNMELTQPVYRKAIAEYLAGRGMRDPKIKITQIIRADLDGDGEEEVLISATNYQGDDESAPTESRAGDYSFVLLREVRAGKVETRMIDGEFYKKDKNFNAPNVHRVEAILDLDGDGKMELVLTSNYYEGGTTTIYRYTPSATKELVAVSCGA